MRQTGDKRADPSELLSQIEEDEQKKNRGRLKIFFGSSAGVGKTYAMLQEARRRQHEGLNFLVGVVETHERSETKALLAGLPLLPRLAIDHRGIKLSEFDLDEALRCKPSLILIDELAHTNAPGCRHPKRWQDVEELLNAGIDVYTTLNVQHLESLNDIVESITGIPVREMVPDIVFDEADDIVLVDTPPDELLNRLREGKVYIAPGANERAFQNFFKKTNLLSLRELALRRTADYVDADTDSQRRREGLYTPNTAGDRIMVCIGPDKFAAKLVRTARRLASALKAPWVAVYVEVAGENARNPRIRQHVQQVLQSAERNGADVVTLQGGRVGDELINFAREKSISKIVIAKSKRSALNGLFKPNLAEFIIAQSGEMDIYVVTTPAVVTQGFNRRKPFSLPRFWLQEYILSLSMVAVLTAIGYSLNHVLSPSDVIMVYLVGAVIVATRLGRGPAMFYSVFSVCCLNYFFIEPVFSLTVYNLSYWLTFTVMFFACFVMSTLASKLRDQVFLSRRRERETQMFYNLTKQLSVAQSQSRMGEDLSNCIIGAMQADTQLWYADEAGALKASFGVGAADTVKEEIVVKWCFDNGIAAGLGTDTMPGAERYYMPIKGTRTVLGVAAITPKTEDGLLLPDQVLMLETFMGLLASALERFQASETSEKNKLLMEKEKMRNILLSSVSHDLRSPLSAITGAVDTLLQTQQNGLLISIRKEAIRLTKIISNLLDITRIDGGQIKLNMHPYYPAEIIGSAGESCREALKGNVLTLDVPDTLPLVMMDGLLISQVIQNLLENAAHHTPAGTQVNIQAAVSGGRFRIAVSDNGPGIPKGQEAEIFKKFATFSHGDRPKGTGLGLAICQAIMAAHHGRIWAENKQAGGSRFILELPENLIMRDPP